MPAQRLNLRGFAGIRVFAELRGEVASKGAKSIVLGNSEWGYVTIHVTKFRPQAAGSGNGMSLPSKRPSFGQDLVGAMAEEEGFEPPSELPR